jgi:aminoglycoside phosphotransferase (APT) family kinase protein
MLNAASLTEPAARQIVGAGPSDDLRVTLLRAENHTWRIAAADAVRYLKAHTKPWYGGDPDAAGRAVQHEAVAHRLLAEAGLPTPIVQTASSTRDNPLGWPYLLTAELAGTSLVDLLPMLSRPEADDALRQVGRHLAGMHALRYEHPGYLVDGPPVQAPTYGFQHPSWRFESFLTAAMRTWANDSTEVTPTVMDRLAHLVADSVDDARRSFDPPRFIHGDCHANGFFLDRATSGWTVTGVLDLEVSSAGCPLFDFTKLFIELTGHLTGSGYRWWEPLYDGYGREPDLNVVRLLLAASSHINYTCLGDHAWPGDRQTILSHIVTATGWDTLFNPADAAAA